MKAEDILAVAGAKKVEKSASRVAAEGVVLAIISADQRCGTMIEINCETDFVAKDENFRHFSQRIVELMQQSLNLDDLRSAAYSDGITVDQARESLISKLGENIQLRRFERVEVPEGGCVSAYLHGDRIGVLLAINQPLESVAKDLAMQVAAMRPQYIEPSQVPKESVEREKAILVERSKDSTKPSAIIEKMIEGQLNKYLGELCLLGQPFIKHPDETVEQLLKSHKAQVLQMLRFEVGEGLAVEKKSFYDEVMAQADQPK